jgi:hypothetical protein
MSDPAWQPFAIQDGANFTFPNPQTFDHAGGNQSQIICPSVISGTAAYFEISIPTAPGSQYCLGVMAASIANASTANIRVNYNSIGNCSWVAENGAVFSNANYAGFSLSGLSGSTVVGIYINAANTGVAYTEDGITWNGSFTTAQIVAGTGLISLGFSGPLVAFVSISGSAGSLAIRSSSACSYGLPSGASYLLPNAVLAISDIDCVEGSAANIVWTAGNAALASGGIEYSLDGGAWTALSGGVTGTGGTAIGPTISDYNLHSIAIRETGRTLDLTAMVQVFAGVPGTPIVNTVVTLLGSTSQTIAFGSIYTSIIFALNAESADPASYTTPGGAFAFEGVPVVDAELIGFVTQGGPPPNQTVISANDEPHFGTLSSGYSTGPITGTLSLVDAENYAFSITAGGTTVTGTTTAGVQGFEGFNAIAVRQVALGGEGNAFCISISVPPEEQLTLTSVGLSGGNTLSVGGFCNNAVLEQIDISINDGVAWVESASFSSSGGSLAAPFSALGSTLSIGSYEVIVRDHSNPGVESNMLPLTVSGAASGSRVQVFIF